MEAKSLINCYIVGLFIMYFEEEMVKMGPTVGFCGSFTLFGF